MPCALLQLVFQVPLNICGENQCNSLKKQSDAKPLCHSVQILLIQIIFEINTESL